MASTPNVRLNLANRSENVHIVQLAVTAVADVLALDALARDDLGTAVAEACKNVVLHAYDGAEGPLELEIEIADEGIDVVVRDHGIGIRPHLGERTQPHTGIGMPIVHLLSRRVTYTNLPGGGTDLRIEFPMRGAFTLPAIEVPDAGSPFPEDVERGDTVELTLAPQALAEALLPAILCNLATRAGLPGSLLEELRRFTTELTAAAAATAAGGPVYVTAQAATGHAELCIAPLTEVAADELLGSGSGPRLFDRAPDHPMGAGWPAETVSLRLLGLS